jgi:hypothetical protein
VNTLAGSALPTNYTMEGTTTGLANGATASCTILYSVGGAQTQKATATIVAAVP